MAAAFRVTTYTLGNDAAGFFSTSYSLVLEQDLAPDYFVMIFSAGAGGGGATGGRGPDDNFCRVASDPFGTGDLGSVASNRITLARVSSVGNWQGEIIIVESLGGAKDPNGFRLRTVRTIAIASGASTGQAVLTGGEIWDDVDQCTAHWDHGGGGADTVATATSSHPMCLTWLELNDTGGTEINLERDAGGGATGDADHCVYLVEWGAAWTVTSLSATGSNGGLDVNVTGEWNTISIGATVTRASTFIFAGGNSSDNGAGDGALGTVYALGDGITESATETVVGFAAEYPDSRKVRMFVMEHPGLAVDYRSPAIGVNDATGTQAVDTAGTVNVTETYDNTTRELKRTTGLRFCLHWGTMQATGNAFPRPFLGSRHSSAAVAEWVRSRHGTAGVSRLISVDLDAIEGLLLRPDPAVCTAVAPAVAASLLLAQTPAVATAVAPAVVVSFAAVGITLTPDPAICTAVAPAVAASLLLAQTAAVATAVAPAVGLNLELRLAVTPAICTAVVPASGLELLLAQTPAVATAVAPAVGLNLELRLAVTPAICTAVAPAVAASLLLAQTAAVATAVAPAVGLNLELRLAVTPAICTAVAPAVAASLLLAQTPAVATAVAPAVDLSLLLPQTAAVATAVAPTVAVTGLGAGPTLTPGPAIASATLDVRGHPPSFAYPQSAAVATAVAPAVAASLLLAQTAAVATAVAPAVGINLELRLAVTPAICTAVAPAVAVNVGLVLAATPAVATAVAPAPATSSTLPQTPAVATAVAPAVRVVADLLLQPTPATLTAAAPAVVIVTPAISLALLPAVVQAGLLSPLLDLPGIEVVELCLAICRTPQPDLFRAMQLEHSLQATRSVLRDLEPARQLELPVQIQREHLQPLER